MILDPPRNDELRDLLDAVCENPADAAAVANLESLLLADNDACRYCLKYLSFHSAMLIAGGHASAQQPSNAMFGAAAAPFFNADFDAAETAVDDALHQAARRSPSLVMPTPLIIVDPSATGPRGSFRSDFTGGLLFSYVAATLILGVMLLGAWFTTFVPYQNVARYAPPTAPARHLPEMVFVGRVSGLVDCRWSDPATETYPGAGVALGRRYALKSGLMEITYDAGAKVILQGPCDYKVESARGGFLYVGKLVARVNEKGEGGREKGERMARGEWRVESEKQRPKTQDLRPSTSGQWSVASGQKKKPALTLALSQRERGADIHPTPHAPRPTPLFSVRTPTATVTDLGTEFGVEVSESGETASHVFTGRVVMRTEGAGDGGRGTGDDNEKSQILNPKSQILLSAGQSARVEKDKKSGALKLTSGEKNDSSAQAKAKFVRRLSKPPKELDLLDIVAGGNGLGNRRERGVEPKSGREATSFQTMMYAGDEQFKHVEWNRLIDGVFVPVRHQRHVQLDSAGHTFDEFGFGPGGTGCPIWARAADVSPVNQRVYPSCWAYSIGPAEQFMPKRRGLLCLHSNTGITFNLEAMRRLHAGVRPARFRAVAGLADARRYYPDAYGMADLWVFVDGQLLSSAKKLRPEDGTVSIDVLIAADARFLTLVTTDAHNGASYDWLVFGDPILEMLPDDATQAKEDRLMEH